MISKEKKKEYDKKFKELHKIKPFLEESKKKKKPIRRNVLGKTPGRICKFVNNFHKKSILEILL